MFALDHYELLFNSSPVPTAIFSPSSDPIFLAVNDAFLQVSTRTRPDLIGTRLFAQFAGSAAGGANPSAAALKASIAQAIATGEPQTMPAQHYPIKVKQANGEEVLEHRYWNAVNTPVFGPTGQLVCIQHQTIDITERIRAEEQQQKSAHRVRLATDAARLGIWVWDVVNDTRTWENDRLYEMFGVPITQEPVNAARFISEFIHPDDIGPYKQAIANALATGERFYFVGRFYRASDQALRWFEFTGLLQRGSAGKPLHMTGTAADITERKEAEQRLQQLASDLAEANRRKTEFLATLAHELRNPLAPIRSGLELMRVTDDNPATIARVRGMMERQLDHLVHLINDLLDIARINSGKLVLKRAAVTVKSVVTSALEATLPLIEANHHQLTVDMPDAPLWLHADPTRLAQVLTNLLTNSAKYTPNGGRITLSARVEGNEVVVAVSDSGIGIPAESLPNVFDMFSQVGQNMRHAQGGLGIGLALVLRLVEMHGGSITAFSAGTNQGSTFTVRLPLQAPNLPANRSGAIEIGQQHRAAGLPLRILIADDNRDAADTLSQLLRTAGHLVQAVYDGEQAINVANEFRPDVALVDIGMPGMNGYDVARAIRTQSGLRSMVLVAVTGWGAHDDRAKTREAGFDHHLTKPVGMQAITKLLPTPIGNLTSKAQNG